MVFHCLLLCSISPWPPVQILTRADPAKLPRHGQDWAGLTGRLFILGIFLHLEKRLVISKLHVSYSYASFLYIANFQRCTTSGKIKTFSKLCHYVHSTHTLDRTRFSGCKFPKVKVPSKSKLWLLKSCWSLKCFWSWICSSTADKEGYPLKLSRWKWWKKIYLPLGAMVAFTHRWVKMVLSKVVEVFPWNYALPLSWRQLGSLSCSWNTCSYRETKFWKRELWQQINGNFP